jgi:predicted RNase H-like nuclease (RuvC/YqgF family)
MEPVHNSNFHGCKAIKSDGTRCGRSAHKSKMIAQEGYCGTHFKDYTIEKQSRKIHELKTRLSELKTKLSDFSKEFAKLSQEHKTLKRANEDLEYSVKHMRTGDE